MLSYDAPRACWRWNCHGTRQKQLYILQCVFLSRIFFCWEWNNWPHLTGSSKNHFDNLVFQDLQETPGGSGQISNLSTLILIIWYFESHGDNSHNFAMPSQVDTPVEFQRTDYDSCDAIQVKPPISPLSIHYADDLVHLTAKQTKWRVLQRKFIIGIDVWKWILFNSNWKSV